MTERKFTDEEIIKALEYIADTEDYKLINYPDVRAHSAVKVINLAIGLVNRQKAEIERLEAENKLLVENNISTKYPCCVLCSLGIILTKTLDDYDNLIGDISAEAIKDFAERLKKADPNRFAGADHFHEVYWDDDFDEEIDNLVKEMIGAQNERSG